MSRNYAHHDRGPPITDDPRIAADQVLIRSDPVVVDPGKVIIATDMVVVSLDEIVIVPDVVLVSCNQSLRRRHRRR